MLHPDRKTPNISRVTSPRYQFIFFDNKHGVNFIVIFNTISPRSKQAHEIYLQYFMRLCNRIKIIIILLELKKNDDFPSDRDLVMYFTFINYLQLNFYAFHKKSLSHKLYTPLKIMLAIYKAQITIK